METDYNPRALGLVLDLTLRHARDGRRILDIVKQQIADFIRITLEEEEVFYLYHPEILIPEISKGEQVASVCNYEGSEFNLALALKQTLFILANEDPDLRRYLILITDKDSTSGLLDKIRRINIQEQLDADIVCIRIGVGGELEDAHGLKDYLQEVVL